METSWWYAMSSEMLQATQRVTAGICCWNLSRKFGWYYPTFWCRRRNNGRKKLWYATSFVRVKVRINVFRCSAGGEHVENVLAFVLVNLLCAIIRLLNYFRIRKSFNLCCFFPSSSLSPLPTSEVDGGGKKGLKGLMDTQIIHHSAVYEVQLVLLPLPRYWCLIGVQRQTEKK